jgi:hypothetical protein
MPGFYMAINFKKFLLFAIILFGFICFLPAQTTGYFFEEDSDELKIIQRFVWSGGEYALQYEVVFEKEIDGEYIAHLSEFTFSQFIEVSLPPGTYRFRVIPYDILEKPAEPSDWININVLSILQQEELEEPAPELDAELELEPETEPEAEEEPEFESEPESVPEQIPEVEPESEPEQTQSVPLKPLLIRAGAVLGLRLPIYGNDFGTYNFPINAAVRASMIFKTPFDIYIGPEVTGSIYQCGVIEKGDMFVYTFGINFLAMKWLPNEKFAVGIKMGGLIPVLSLQGDLSDASDGDLSDIFSNNPLNNYLNSTGLIPNIGASFYWLIMKNLLLEIGFDYIHIFSDIPSGYFRPTLGISWQF